MTKTTTISGTVTHTIFPGQHGYRDTLTITGTGLILPATIYGVPSSYGAAGIVIRPKLDGASITNMGTVSGGAGRVYGQYTLIAGGSGIAAAGTNAVINNSGLITGGVGAHIIAHFSASGIGVDLSGAGSSLLNTGDITGGTGLTTYDGGGNGGTGVSQTASGTLVNDGVITGGNGGDYLYAGPFSFGGGDGGVGLNLSGAGAVAFNHGTVSGGVGGYSLYFNGRDGNGVDVSKGATFTNDGTVTGQVGLYASHGAAVVNDGLIAADNAQYPSPGVILASGSTLINNGNIVGGRDEQVGGSYQYPPSSNGANVGTGCSLTNNGTITGGAPSNFGVSSGGIGVSVTGAATLVNTGLIAGGQNVSYQQSGGYGLTLSQVANASNSGTIMGGYGAPGVAMRQSVFTNTGLVEGGSSTQSGGGIGLSLDDGDVINSGTIIGGAGYDATFPSGAGVFVSRGTLTNAGTIAGGVTHGQAASAAILFDGTLAIDPGAVFIGAVEAFTQYDNILQLTGIGAGVLSGLGTEFSGFRTIQETAGANWTLTQANAFETATGIAVGGTLTVTGSLTDAGQANVSAGGSLLAAGNATILLGGINLAGGRLGGAAAAEITVGITTEGIKPGQIMVDAGAAITGYGAINGALSVADRGVIEATGGTLTIGIPVTGTGTLEIGAGATLQTGGAVQVASVLFAPGGNEILSVAKPSALTGTLSGFATHDLIDLKNLQATSASFLAGTLTLLDGTNAVGTLAFSGNYDTGSFALMSDQHGGTDIGFSGGPLDRLSLASQADAGVHLWQDNHAVPWLTVWLAHGVQ